MSSLRPQIAESVSPVQYQTVQLNDESKGVFKGENNESKAQMSHSCKGTVSFNTISYCQLQDVLLLVTLESSLEDDFIIMLLIVLSYSQHTK